MKPAKDYIKNYIKEPTFEELKELIEEVQRDVTDEIVRLCAKNSANDFIYKPSILDNGEILKKQIC